MQTNFAMEILSVAGVQEALQAMRLSWRSGSKGDSTGLHIGPEDRKLALRLLRTRDDHGKWARMVITWIYVNAPRYFWQEMSTYRIGADWASSSTMHTLTSEIESDTYADRFNDAVFFPGVNSVKTLVSAGHTLHTIKSNLPEGFMQDRIGAVSLQTLRRIYQQRRDHELPEWQQFCDHLRDNHPLAEYITAPPRETALLQAKLGKAEARVRELERALRRALAHVTDPEALQELQSVCDCPEPTGADDSEGAERD
jgi:hypothetical protein